ncbi:MAG TPA: hypothetical protein VF898_00220, partial [Chloroflexota bacterium]
MKLFTTKWRWILAILPIAALFFALLPESATAATTVGGNNVTIRARQVVNDDLYTAGQNVNMNGTVTGNLLAAGGNVNVSGHVGGSVMAAGGTITINGVVHDSVIVLGGDLRISGRIGKDVTMLGGTLTLLPGSIAGRDVLTAAGSTVVHGTVSRNLRTTGGTLDLRSGAVIGGDLIYRGTTKPTIPPGVTVLGQVRHEAGGTFFGWSGSGIPWFNIPGYIVWLRGLVGLLALGLLLVWLAPRYTRRTVKNLETRWLASLGWGFAVLICTPILAALIFVVGLFIGGWWLGVIALFTYLVALVLAATIAGLTAVDLVATHGTQPIPLWAAMILGVVFVMLITLVPVVGWAMLALGTIWALGGLTMAVFQRPSEPVVSPPGFLSTVAEG